MRRCPRAEWTCLVVGSLACAVGGQHHVRCLLWTTDAPPLHLGCRRELVLLLLEDPDHRLRIAHCDDLMHSRLPGVYMSSGNNSNSPIKLAIAHDPICQRIFYIEPSPPALPTVASLTTDWGQALLRLDIAELARWCAQLEEANQISAILSAIPAPLSVCAPAPGAMEQAMLMAVAATWPQYSSDDDDYVATALGYMLASKQDPQLQLPPCSLHLSDLQAWLRVISRGDARLLRRCAGLLGDVLTAGAPPATAQATGTDAWGTAVEP